jgi:hypothetical protein
MTPSALSVQARLHPHAHRDGGLVCCDDQLLQDLRRWGWGHQRWGVTNGPLQAGSCRLTMVYKHAHALMFYLTASGCSNSHM